MSGARAKSARVAPVSQLHKPPPTPPRRAPWRGDKYGARFLNGALASTGLRGRVDARGRPRHTPSGLTRTSGLCAGVPSRDRRGTTPSASRCSAKHQLARDAVSTCCKIQDLTPSQQHSTQRPSSAAAAGGRSSVTRRSAGRLARGSRQARRRVSRLAAGIDAASMARRCQSPFKKWRMFFSTRQGARRGGVGGGLCSWETGATRALVACDPGTWSRPARVARKNSSGSPLNPAVQAGFRRTAIQRNKPPHSPSLACLWPARSERR